MNAKRLTAFEAINNTVMILVMIVTLYPIWYIFINSLQAPRDAVLGTVSFLPKSVALDSYQAVFKNGGILQAFWITFARTLVATSVHVLFTAMVAFALSKRYLIGRKLYMKIGLVTMLFNGGLIPNFLLINKLGLYDTFWAYVFPSMFNFYNLIIFMTFFKTISLSLEESAKIDGAGDFRVFWSIILPNSKAVLATIALFAGVYNWNDYFLGIIYVKNKNLLPIQTVLFKIIAENSMTFIQQQALDMFGRRIPSDSIKFASMVIVTLPIISIYPFLQKFLVKGVMIGAIKE